MSYLQKNIAILGLVLSVTLPVSSFAQTDITNMATTTVAMTDGEVKKVDQDTGRVTIKHSDIKHLEMPSMTMVFTVKNKALLAATKPGDKIRFMVVNEGGKMIITDLQPRQ